MVVEAEDADVAERAGGAAVVGRAGGLGGVLDDDEAVLAAIAMIASSSAGQPKMSTTTIAFVRGVIRSRTERGSSPNVSRLDVGEHRAPRRGRARTAADAVIVYGETITSSPGPTPAAAAAA